MNQQAEDNQGYTSIHPAEPCYTQTEWGAFLSLVGFEGNIANAADLLETHSHVLGELSYETKKMIPGFKQPPFAFLADENAMDTVYRCVTGGEWLLLKKSWLEYLSQFDPDTAMLELKTKRGEVALRTTPRNWFRLATVEEFDHAEYDQNPPLGRMLPSQPDAFLDLSQAEYDADDMEYRALKRQIHYAKRHHLPEDLISQLNNRYIAASEVRAKKIPLRVSKENYFNLY
jgi:hypothetical protein